MYSKIPGFSDGKLSSGGRTALCVVTLFAVNAFIGHKLFVTEYLPYMGSIAGAYIGLTRYILEHAPDLAWFPLWYGGIPFENTYSPLFHFVVAVVAWLTGFSPALSHHVSGALAYCLGPVALFCLAYYLSRDRVSGFVAGLGFSLLSPSMVLMPSLASDLGSVGGARRLQALVMYGDSPHIAALLLIPIGIIALDRAIKRPTAIRFFAAVLVFVCIGLMNWLGAFAAALAVVALLLSRLEVGWRRWAVVTIGVGITAYAIAAPLIPPSNVATIRHNAQYTVGSYAMGGEHLMYAAVLLLLLTGLMRLLDRADVAVGVRFSCVFLFLIGAIPLAVEWLGLYIVPQPTRYHHELDMAIVLAASLAVVPWVRRQLPIVKYPVAVAGLVLALLQIYGFHAYARTMVRSVDIQSTVEYETARWLDQNLHGRRVFASGSVRFWLNAFSDSPQISGGFDQGMRNPLIRNIKFAIPFLMGDGPQAATWLKALGAHAVIVSGPNGRDAYRDYRDPKKFDGVLDELWRDGDDVIYGVPQRSDSLARVIRREHVVKRQPVNGEDVEPVRPYVAGLEDSSLPLVTVDWETPHAGLLEAQLKPDHLVSVQISHHPGWSATVNGTSKPVVEDGLGFMLIEPGCDGPCRIELLYDGGFEMAAAKAARFLVLFLGLLWVGLEWRRPSVVVSIRDGLLLPLGRRIEALARRTADEAVRHPAAFHVTVLFAVSAFVCRELFATEYLGMGSIEGAYVGLSRYILEHFLDYDWFPLWYGGIPFENAYPPLLPFSTAFLSWLSGFSVAWSQHVVWATAYCLGPVTLYLLAYHFTRDRVSSFVAGLIYALFSPAALLLPTVAADVGSLWGARRLQSLLAYGAGPHVAAMTLLPLALIALDRTIEKLTSARFVVSVLCCAAVVLTNWHAFPPLVVAAAALALSRGRESRRRDVGVIVAVGIAACALASPWMPLSLIGTIWRNAELAGDFHRIGSAQLLMGILVLAAAAGLSRLLFRWRLGRPARFALLFFFLMALPPLLFEWTGLYFVPRPFRFHLEMEMTIALLLGLVVTLVPASIPRNTRAVALGFVIFVAGSQLARYSAQADRMIGSVDVDQTVEYQSARWLDENLPGKRIFAAGSTQFWLNAFADNPQLGGGFDEGTHNPRIPHVRFGIPYTLDDGELSVAWLRAYGVQAVVVGGKKTRDVYQIYRDAAKFDGLLPELWRDGDDVIYEVPHRSDSLAKVIRRADVVTKAPADQNDVEAMLRYVRAFEDDSSPEATLAWLDAGTAVIEADLQPVHVVSVQISHHPAWSATVEGRMVRVRRDGLGQMIVEPRCDGPCRIELRYEGSWDMTLAKWFRGLVLVMGLVWLGWDWRRKRKRSTG